MKKRRVYSGVETIALLHDKRGDGSKAEAVGDRIKEEGARVERIGNVKIK